MIELLDDLLRRKAAPPGPPPKSVAGWWRALAAERARWSDPLDRAVAAGFAAPVPGFAFAAGYHCALRRLLPDLDDSLLASFCVTEAGGNHPAKITTSLQARGDGFSLSGEKSFVTLAGEASRLLVVASEGRHDDGRNRLALVEVEVDAPGVSLAPHDRLPFVPEISHAAVRFEDTPVPAAARRPGDGYADYVKPFRTVEDIHVFAGIAGYLLRLSRAFDWPRSIVEELTRHIVGLRTLALAPSLSPAVHIALAGEITASRAVIASLTPHFETGPDRVREIWQRDAPLLQVAGGARKKRIEAAWRALEGKEPTRKGAPRGA